MNLLITGGCGFVGSNLAAEALKRHDKLTVLDNLSRTGSKRNLEWLRSQGNFDFICGNTFEKETVDTLLQKGKFDAVFHLAGQVAMTTSISDPLLDFRTNVCGSFLVLDAIRRYSPETQIVYSSTNKVYGDLEQYSYDETASRYICREFPSGFPETVPLDFHSPYGCSKGAADQYMLDFYRTFGIKSVVFRHSSMYGGQQFATFDQGWIGWFCQKALEQKKSDPAPFTISGNGKQVRDILHADDIVRLYFSAVENRDKLAGQAFNIGGGISQSLSLLELFSMLEDKCRIKLNYTKLPPRLSDQKVFVADNTKITSLTGWKPRIAASEGISRMLDWLEKL